MDGFLLFGLLSWFLTLVLGSSLSLFLRKE
jgi:hypothetical protein